MAYYLDSTLIFVDLLRTYLQDPKQRISLEGNKSYTASNKRFITVTATGNISYISNVQIDGVEQEKYKTWLFDPKTLTLIFNENVTGEVTYDVYVGTNWIYHDRPKSNLNDFPRVSITPISSPSTVLGNDKAKITTNYRFQINTFCKEKQGYTISINDDVSVYLEGLELSNYINEKIYDIFDTYRDNLFPYYANYTLEVKKGIDNLNSDIVAYSTRQEFTIQELKQVS